MTEGREEALHAALVQTIAAVRLILREGHTFMAGVDAQRALGRVARAERALGLVAADQAGPRAEG